MGRLNRRPAVATALSLALVLAAAGLGLRASKPRVALARDDASGRLTVLVDGREALVFRYSPDLDLVHYGPLRGPSGRNMLIEKTEPYPHHRSFWFADTVRVAGVDRDLSFYNALYSGAKTSSGDYGPPFRERVRLVSFPKLAASRDRAEIEAVLVWESDGRPVLDERRRLIVHALGRGEYLLDLAWTLSAVAGDVSFVSDDVHYAWPFLRLDPVWNGEHGGTITADSGATGEKATNMQPARWIDYSNTVEGRTEGLAVFQFPDGAVHRWLTREYGTFGPRRPDDRSGRPFSVRKGESLTQRAGVLVHAGDAASGRVAERYDKYVRGGFR